MAQQLNLDLPAIQALGRDDFFVSEANALAVALIETPQAWAGGKLVLSGPAGAGKSHLVQIWAELTGAQIVAATQLARGDVPALAQGPVAVEDVPDIKGDAAAQEALFHLHNLVLAEGHRLLLTGRAAPGQWALPLPDLQSRIEAAQHVAIASPDDRLLAAVLAKLFADRQVIPKPNVIPYLVDHMDRSFAAAGDLVARMDHIALSETRTLSRSLAARLIEKQGDPD